MPPQAWYEIYVKPWNPQSAKFKFTVGMRTLSLQ
jgi:hypothetical protein